MDAAQTHNDVIFSLRMHGFQNVRKISNCLQGELYRAETSAVSADAGESTESTSGVVAIKRASKKLLAEGCTEQDGMTFFVQENILREALILKLLTAFGVIGNYTVSYVDFFEDAHSYYLVLEYVDGISLKQYVEKAHQLISERKLSLQEYTKSIKFVMWQLLVTLHSLHRIYHCCHLDLCLENVMLQNATFTEHKDGIYKLSDKISVKLCDFGVAEIFNINSAKNHTPAFQCHKDGLSVDNGLYIAPKAYGGECYDARATDLWSVGMMLYQCLTNQPLYSAEDVWYEDFFDTRNPYFAAMHGQLKLYLARQKRHAHLTSCKPLLDLLLGLLHIDEKQRLNTSRAITHAWFARYYKVYASRIGKKASETALQLQKSHRTGTMKTFPFYKVASGFAAL